MSDLLRLFAADDADAFPVESRGQLVGIVSKADALKAFELRPGEMTPHYDDLLGTTVDEVMTRHVMTVDGKTRLQRVLHLMIAHHFKSLPVVDDRNRLLGMIRREDVIRALIHSTRRPALPLRSPSGRLLRDRVTSASWPQRPAANASRINSDMLRAPVLAMRLAR